MPSAAMSVKPIALPLVSKPRGDLLASLLKSAASACYGGRSALRPIWTMEAVGRATKAIRLVAMMERRLPSAIASTEALLIEHGRTMALVDLFKSIEQPPERSMVPCGCAVRGAASNLVGLVGPLSGNMVLSLHVAGLDLPAYQRRALILLVTDLISDILLLDDPGETMSGIDVEFGRIDDRTARLRISYHGFGAVPPWFELRSSFAVAQDLALLLESRIDLHPLAKAGMAEITFPCPEIRMHPLPGELPHEKEAAL